VAIQSPPSSTFLALASKKSMALRSSPSSPHGPPWSLAGYSLALMEVASRCTSTGTELPPVPQINLDRGGQKWVVGGCFLMPSQALGLGQSSIYDNMPTVRRRGERGNRGSSRRASGSCGCSLWERRVRVRGARGIAVGSTYSGGHGAPRPPGRPRTGSVVP
jgi:hypothetical protein